jgi:PAS domain S-box-containing protein
MKNKWMIPVPAFAVFCRKMPVYIRNHSSQNLSNAAKYQLIILIIPLSLLFTGCNGGIQNNSTNQANLHLFGSLLFLILPAVALIKPDNWKITHKGLVLIALPLIILLVFIALVLNLKRHNQEAQAQSLHSKEVIAQTQSILQTLVDAETGMRGYIISADKKFTEPYQQSIAKLPDELNQLETLVQDNPRQEERARHISVEAAEKIFFIKQAEQLVHAGFQDEAISQIKSGQGKRLMDEARQQIAVFLQEEERLDSLRQQALAASWQRFNQLLLAGVSVSILLMLILASFFSRSIQNRLMTLTLNAQALADGKELATPMEGEDEIAHLDKTFHKMAEALSLAAQKERALIHNATEIICSLDAEGRYVNINPASLKLWGYKPEELIGQHYSELVVQEDLARTEEAEAATLQGQDLSDFENKIRSRDGTEVCMTWSATWSETEQLMFCVARDVTARKRAEEIAEKHKLALEETAAELTSINKELEAFSYSVSHDLRAPLRHIDGFANLLQKSASATLDEKGRRYLNTISEAARQMGQLIDDLLAFSRIGRTEMSTITVNLEELVRQVQHDLQPEANGRKINWQIHPLPQVQADPSMLKLVIVNLLSNALKYTRNCPEAHIEIGNLNDQAGQTTIFVRDNGAGFDMKYVDKLFGVFQRLHSMSEFEGTGIGLANVRRIIHRHGGKTWAEGKVNDGAIFYFSLPMAQKGKG